jgi:cobaltochelatase CobN
VAWICDWLVPNLQRAGDEIDNLLAGLDGRYVPAGPSGTLTRGGAHVLPTGRNFYSLDPRALPTPLAWDVGCRLADALIARHLDEEGSYPQAVGLVLGHRLIRTQGDDGPRPSPSSASGRSGRPSRGESSAWSPSRSPSWAGPAST